MVADTDGVAVRYSLLVVCVRVGDDLGKVFLGEKGIEKGEIGLVVRCCPIE